MQLRMDGRRYSQIFDDLPLFSCYKFSQLSILFLRAWLIPGGEGYSLQADTADTTYAGPACRTHSLWGTHRLKLVKLEVAPS
jgi:hypothetical protein